MPRHLRVLLLAPLVGLTLFFVVLGWYNWRHVTADEELWAQFPSFLLPPAKTGNIFQPHRRTVVGIRNEMGKTVSLSSALFAHLQQLYPQWPIVNYLPPYRTGDCCLIFEKPRFIDHFSVRCSAGYVLGAAPDDPNGFPTTCHFIFYLKRSPLDIWGEDWFVVKQKESFS